MSVIKTYKDLKVWQKGIEIVKMVYLFCNEMPNAEIFGLQSQIKRAAVSIPSNIAEGYGRNSSKSFAQFLKIARGSLMELETQLFLAKELMFLSDGKYTLIEKLIEEEGKMLNAFIKSIENN